MNRSALKPIVSTPLMAVAAVLLWQFWIAVPCLGTQLGAWLTIRFSRRP